MSEISVTVYKGDKVKVIMNTKSNKSKNRS